MHIRTHLVFNFVRVQVSVFKILNEGSCRELVKKLHANTHTQMTITGAEMNQLFFEGPQCYTKTTTNTNT